MTELKNIYFQKLAEKDPEKYGENFGKYWSQDEEKQLLKLVKEHKTMLEIAKEHKRSEGAIRAKLQHASVKLHKEGKTNEEIKKIVKLLTTKEIDMAIERDKNKVTSKKNIINENKELVDVMKDIRNLLHILVVIEIKENGWEEDKFFKNLIEENNVKQLDDGLDKITLTEQVSDNSDNESSKKLIDDIWTEELLSKMKKYKGDETHEKNKKKLKQLRLNHDIPVEDFYEKLKEL